MSQLISTFSDQNQFNLIDWNILTLDSSSIFAIGKNLIQPQLTMIMTKIENKNSEIYISDIELKSPTLLIFRGNFIRDLTSIYEWICKFHVYDDYYNLQIYQIDNGSEILINELKQDRVFQTISSEWSKYSYRRHF